MALRFYPPNLKQEALRDPDTKKYYESLEEKFSIIEEFMRARKTGGKTQLDIAESMDIKASVIVVTKRVFF